MKTTYAFSRRGRDWIAHELATVLSAEGSLGFQALFSIVHANLKAANRAGCGEEMLRLRTYDKLRNLVDAGFVSRAGKEYRGILPEISTFVASAMQFYAEQESRPPKP